MKTLLIGASGLLGKELQKYIKCDCPSHQKLDITKPPFLITEKYDLVINAAAYTNVEKAEVEKLKCFDVNVRGVLNLVEAFQETPFVYISSEYARNPVNFYSLTKSFAEELVMDHPNHLTIRTLFKPRPWKYPKAFTDQMTQGDYVDVIAPLIVKAIGEWNREPKLIYIGTGRKTIFDLAVQSRPDVKPMSINDIKTVKLPADYQ